MRAWRETVCGIRLFAAAACFAVGVAAYSHAQSPEAPFQGFASDKARAALLERLGRLYGEPARELPLKEESFGYRVFSKGIPVGRADFSLQTAERMGRPVYIASLRVELAAGRGREDYAEIDAAGLFPCRYEKRARHGEETRVDSILWDQVGSRFFLQGVLLRGGRFDHLRYREERLLEPYAASETLDPLSAVLIARLKLLLGRPDAREWAASVIEGAAPAESAVFKTALAQPDVLIHTRASAGGKETVSMRLDLDPQRRALPFRVEGKYYGVPFTLELQQQEKGEK